MTEVKIFAIHSQFLCGFTANFKDPYSLYSAAYSPPEDGEMNGEMNEMTLSSRHRIRNSNAGGLRSSTLPLGHGGSPQYWVSHVDREEHFCFYWTAETRNRAPNSSVKGSGANHYLRAPAHHSVGLYSWGDVGLFEKKKIELIIKNWHNLLNLTIM